MRDMVGLLGNLPRRDRPAPLRIASHSLSGNEWNFQNRISMLAASDFGTLRGGTRFATFAVPQAECRILVENRPVQRGGSPGFRALSAQRLCMLGRCDSWSISS